MGSFETAYRQLNEAQKQAVDAIDGPVLVVAGPGTGKTQLLTTRIANILKKTDADPANILCLTFTNKAATNMRDRLVSLIGPASHNVVARTFHSFAAEVMNMYPDSFWNGARLLTAPDAVQLEIIRGILAKLPLNDPLALKFAGAYTAVNDVQRALQLVKEAGLTPDKLRAIIALNTAFINIIEPILVEILQAPLSSKKLSTLQRAIEHLPEQEAATPLISLSTVLKESLAEAIANDEGSGKTVFTSKWKTRWLQTVEGKKGMINERRRNDWWLSLADVYDSYRETLHHRGYYDYSDMLIEVITQLEQNPEMRADIQERFMYVLIDEFQDTNAAQLRLAHLVADHYAAAGKPNLMAVGDDDQSIFAFNGAELNNMLSFRRSYPDTKIIVLEDNYRSSQAILDAAKAIIEQADDRLVKREAAITKNLHAVRPPKESSTIEHVAYPTREHQLSAVTKRIQQTWNSTDGSVAVLARSHDSLKQIAALLLKAKVPVRYEQQSNLLENEPVMQVTTIAEIVIAIQSGDEATVNAKLAELMRHPMWALTPKKLWKLALSNYSEPKWLDSLLDSDDEGLANIGGWLVWLAREASHAPLALMLEYIIGMREGSYLNSPLHDYFLKLQTVSNSYLETLSAIELLRVLSDEFAAGNTPTLGDFVGFIELNRDMQKIVTDESWFASDEKAVQLLTVHKAKGLEFDTVFVVDATEDIWKPRAGGRKPPANLPLQRNGDTYDDYVRLLYVAATRAKHSLIISSYYSDEQGRELLATPLISNIPLQIITKETADEPIIVLENALSWPRLETSNEKALLAGKLEKYALSATGLIHFLDVTGSSPQYFFERHILRLPAAKTANMAYGTAVHSALETAQRLVNSKQFNINTVLDRYDASLRDEHLPPAEFERFLPHGQAILKSLFKNNRLALVPGGLAEQSITNVRLGTARLSGKLDRIDTEDKKLLITDYKTGKPLSSFTTKDQSKAIKAWKHRTQLIFYTLLAQASDRYTTYDSFEGQIIYVEAEKTQDLLRSYIASAEELAQLTKLIDVVWQHIMKLDFPDISGYATNIHGIEKFCQDLLDGSI